MISGNRIHYRLSISYTKGAYKGFLLLAETNLLFRTISSTTKSHTLLIFPMLVLHFDIPIDILTDTSAIAEIHVSAFCTSRIPP